MPGRKPHAPSAITAANERIPGRIKKYLRFLEICIGLRVETRQHQEAAELGLFIEAEREYKGARHGNGGQHRNKHTEPEHQRKAFDKRGGEPKENYRRND